MITVLGATGFIGSSLVKKLKEGGIQYNAPLRGEELKGELGDVIYCIGLTADFRRKPFETVEAHVCLLNRILGKGGFNSLTYLSSTRVYISSKETEVAETSPIQISIGDPDELYTLTKLTGERICLSSGHKVRIARLSNVYGRDPSSDNFLTDIGREIKSKRFIRFRTSAVSSKDYISIEDVTSLLISIATHGNQDIYNIASGENLTNSTIIDAFKEKFEFDYEFEDDARDLVFPRINIDRIRKEFGYSGNGNKNNLADFIKNYSHDTN